MSTDPKAIGAVIGMLLVDVWLVWMASEVPHPWHGPVVAALLVGHRMIPGLRSKP